MGKFINTTHTDTINAIVEGGKERLKNPYYLFTDKKATIVTYYNANVDKTTVDEGTGNMYSFTDGDAPLRFNKIENAYLFGMTRIETDLQMGDWGLESESIESTAYVAPNTFVPYPQDYFFINHVDDSHMIFKVTSVTMDTFEDGANFWRIDYKLSLADADHDRLESQVVDTYVMNTPSFGTNLKSVVRKAEYEFLELIENTTTMLKGYFQDLFFKNRLQTFIYEHNLEYFYDPFMIEFLKRNNILSGAKEFIYVDHQTFVPRTFGIDYDQTFFRSLEVHDKKKHLRLPSAYGTAIYDRATLFYHRPDTYFEVSYKPFDTTNYPIPYAEEEMLDMIKDGKEYAKDSPLAYNNIIIRYFNNIEFKEDIFDIIGNMSFEPNVKMFYAIPMIIYVLEYYARQILKK